MKILQLCKKFPYPLKDGESIAVTYLSKALHELGCEITLLCMNTTKHYTDVQTLPQHFNHYKEIHASDLDNSIKPLDAFKNLFSKDSYHVSRFVSEDYEKKLTTLLQENEFDIIQLETLYLAPYVDTIRNYSDAIITMRAHNVEHEIWERIKNNTRLLPKKWYISYLTKKLKRFEIENLNTYDYLIAVTDKDLSTFKKLGYKNGAIASPIGIDISAYKGEEVSHECQSMCFIGSLDWMPNLEGVDWFLQNVWEKAKQENKQLEFHIAGRNTPNSIRSLKDNMLKVHGEVPSAINFIKSHPIMLVPLFSGSGMRVKILEGLALGRIVITTSLGLEGIDAKHKQEVLIADTPQEFLDAISFCQSYPRKVKEMSARAMVFVEKYYNNHHNAHNLKSLYTNLLKKYKTSPSVIK